jgi:hypothetical protein
LRGAGRVQQHGRNNHACIRISGMACLAQAQASCVRDGTGIRTCVYMHDGMGITHTGRARAAARAHASRCAYARSGGARAAARAQTHEGRKHRACAMALCMPDGTNIVCARWQNQAGRARWHAQALCVRDGTSIMCARGHGQYASYVCRTQPGMGIEAIEA